MQIEELVFVGSLGWFGAAAAIAMPLLLFWLSCPTMFNVFFLFFLLGSFTLLNKNDLKALEWLWALSFFPFTTNLLMWMLSASNFWRRNFGKNHVQHLFPSLLRFFFSEGKTERRESNFDGVGGKESRPESKHRLEITFCYRESILLNLSQSLTRYLNPSRHSAFCPIDDLSSP